MYTSYFTIIILDGNVGIKNKEIKDSKITRLDTILLQKELGYNIRFIRYVCYVRTGYEMQKKEMRNRSVVLII